MIAIDIRAGFLIYLCLALGAAAALGARHWWQTWGEPWNISEENVCRCSGCLCTFLVRRRARSAVCPRCGQTYPNYRKQA
ncbi:MAG: hypothetical protein BWZ02_02131 [Lentisphaerae bacterium ADurb.BinA184]|nr:MAG: hypothetical protein BWZ02_02131 [Lentisphaerae bacterium ADurb.BinA184]